MKKNPINVIRGWLPEKPSFSSHPKQPINSKSPQESQAFIRFAARGVIAVTITASLLGILGGVLGLDSGFGFFVWPIITVAVANFVWFWILQRKVKVVRKNV